MHVLTLQSGERAIGLEFEDEYEMRRGLVWFGQLLTHSSVADDIDRLEKLDKERRK